VRRNQAAVFSGTLSALLIASCLLGVCSSQEKPTTKKPSLIDGLLFYPSKASVGNWRPEGLPLEDVPFESADGTKLHCWYCKCENPQAIVLYAHGNAGNVATRGWLLRELLTKVRVTVFLFDYRGYGRSEGKATIDGALADTRAARKKLGELASIKDSEMLLMGESLGGAMVVQLAAESAPRGLILQSTFSSLRDIAKVHFPSALAGIVDARTLDSMTQIGRYSGPLLQSHGDADRVIPFELGQKLFGAANEPKTFYTVPNANHDNWLTSEYVSELVGFISKLPR
jgi:uncharacterized protein